MIGRRTLACAALLLLLAAGSPVRADMQPLPRVGRVASAEGDLMVRNPGAAQPDGSPKPGDWTGWARNYPIAAGMAVRTATKGRAVLRVGAEAIALAGGTEIEVLQLDSSGTQLALRRGRIGIRLSQADPARSIEVDIPRGGVWLLTPGDYDITAGDEHQPARLAVRDGRARFVGEELDIAVATGGATLLSGSGPIVALPGGGGEHSLAAWWGPALREPPDSPALRHVSAEMTGHDALDEHGRWETIAGYGSVWFPRGVSDDWVPYRDGSWRWIAPWGWTWIDAAPWGFAPSHYGRWARIVAFDTDGGRWGWVPGKSAPHPGYMPAGVAFLGTAGVGLSYPDAFSPAIAWFPLAPGEVYWPSFTDDLDAIRRLNAGLVDDPAAIGSATKSDPPAEIVTGEYRNRRFASVVPRSVFVDGKPVAAAQIELPQRRLENAPLLAGSPQIGPPAPRPAVLLSTAAPAPAARHVAAKVATAAETLRRILDKRHRASAAERSRPGKRHLTAAKPAKTRSAQHRTARPHVAAAPKSKRSQLREAAARRH